MSLPALTPLATAVLHLDRPPERALVLGCGNGEAVLFLAREFPTARIRGVDPSPGRVREATSRVGLDPEGRVAFKRGRGRSIPYPASHFDLLVAVDARPVAGEALRVLRPGGHLLIASTAGGRPGPSSALLWWRLRRRGVELLVAEPAGEGSFSVGRRADRGDSHAAD